MSSLKSGCRYFAMAAVAVCATLVCATDVAAGDAVSFNRDIRPILSDRCFACHGPDANSREGDLRLDQAADATRLRDGYRVVDSAQPAKSELLARVTSTDEYEQMPPPGHGEPLDADEVRLMRNWIEQGAQWQQHWSLTPLQPITPPDNEHAQRSAIDGFVAHQLSQRNRDFSPAADPRILLRRLSFDLTGLPPTPADVEKFIADPSPAAYRQFVEQYLNSPHFGERMAIYWLDLVRYADTLGYHGDQVRSVSPYRDYVINAFNDNKPFDEFVTEQLAGDLLPEATLEQKVASTYNRLNRASGEGGVQPKEYLAKYVADRVRTTGVAFLGTTTGCAECHDHKFDPFTIRDFYSFGAFFADIKELGIVRSAVHIEQLPVPTPTQKSQQQQLEEQLTELERRYGADSPELTSAYVDWLANVRTQSASWKTPVPTQATAAHGTVLTIQPDGTIVASGPNPGKEDYVFTYEFDAETASQLSQLMALKLELFADSSLPAKGPGRAGNGNFVVHAIQASSAAKSAEWKSATATHAQKSHPADNLVTGGKNGWAILPQTGQNHQLQLIAKRPLLLQPDAQADQTNSAVKLVVTISQQHGSGHNLGKFRISFSPDQALIDPLLSPPAEIRELIVAAAPEPNVADQSAKLWEYFRQHTPMLEEIRDHRAQARRELELLKKSIVTTLATTATKPREMRVLPRGDWMDDSGAIVEPAVPHYLPQLDSAERRLNRLDLANWMTDADNPLVSRTFVNRVWMLFLGHGLSRTVDDLGAQGESPTHPELLDWLAHNFIETGWDVKDLVRSIVLSQTYQQSSLGSPELIEQDPYNRLLARQSRWRLDAEMIRDNALQISGLLVDKIGGPSVMPYQPAGYWAQLNFPKRTYQPDTGAKQYRRGLYTHWQRTFLHPSLLAFDAPAREECTARRERSNTPLQALVLLNDPTYLEAAAVFAQQIVERPEPSFRDRLDWAWLQAVSRQPTDQEARQIRDLFETQLEYYRQNPKQAQQLTGQGTAPAADESTVSQLAAWMAVTRTLLNLHETITRY